MIGCMLTAWLADKVGRKMGVQIICVLCLVSAIIQGASVQIAMFLVGRFLNGVGYVSLHFPGCPIRANSATASG